MPARSNEFQKLVLLVKQHVAGGATVTESKFLADRATGADREVDICIEGAVGGHEVVISVECRDRARRADVTWIEEMKAKHERLPTDALVLVSRSGFTSGAIAVAKSYGIELLSISEIDGETVSQLFGELSSVWAKTYDLSPIKVTLHVSATGPHGEEDVDAFPDNLLFRSNGEKLGTVKAMVEYCLNSKQFHEEFGRLGDETHQSFTLGWGQPIDGAGDPIFLQKIETQALREITHVKVVGRCRVAVGEFAINRGALGRVRIAWGTGELRGRPAILVASQDEDGVERLSVAVKGDLSEPEQNGSLRRAT